MRSPMTAAEQRAFNDGLQAALLAICVERELKICLCAPIMPPTTFVSVAPIYQTNKNSFALVSSPCDTAGQPRGRTSRWRTLLVKRRVSTDSVVLLLGNEGLVQFAAT